MSLNRVVSDAVDTLRGDLLRDPEALRAYALDLICELGRADAACWYEFGMIDGDPLPARWRLRNLDESFPHSVLTRRLVSPQGDPRLSDPRMNRRFVTLNAVFSDLDGFLATTYYDVVWKPQRIIDQCRMLVFHNGKLFDFIGCFRRAHQGSFKRYDRVRLSPVADALADALLAVRRIELAEHAEEGCDLLLTPAALVEYASESGARLLAVSGVRAALAVWARGIDARPSAKGSPAVPDIVEGHRLRWARLQGQGQTRYLVQLEPIAPVTLHPGFELSRTQRNIARLACAGASAPEIGTLFGISPETVRTHLRQAYQLLQVSSRAELVLALEGMPSEP